MFFCEVHFWKLCNHRLKVDEDLVMFSLLPKLPVDKALQDVLFYLTCLARYSIWKVRCKVKKEFRSFSESSSLEEFKKKLKFRILVDSQWNKFDRRIFFAVLGLWWCFVQHRCPRRLNISFLVAILTCVPECWVCRFPLASTVADLECTFVVIKTGKNGCENRYIEI